jgi:hypothetical protein
MMRIFGQSLDDELREGRDYYIDAHQMYVFTSHYLLRRGKCCGSGCRHCPYGHENVPPSRKPKIPPPQPFFPD